MPEVIEPKRRAPIYHRAMQLYLDELTRERAEYDLAGKTQAAHGLLWAILVECEFNRDSLIAAARAILEAGK